MGAADLLEFDPVGREKARKRAYNRDHYRGIRHPVVRRSLELRLFVKVDRLYGFEPEHKPWLGPCWPWLGAVNTDGYGVIRGEPETDPETGKRTSALLLAHRVALSLALGRPLGEGMLANHKCDNPTCCRPRHLYEGTPQQNVDDMIESGRYNGWARHKPIARTRLG